MTGVAKGQHTVGLALLGLGALCLVETFRIKDPWTGARLLPLIVALAFLGLGVAHWVSPPGADAPAAAGEKRRVGQVVVVLVLLAGYVALLPAAGFSIATGALIAVLTRMLGRYSWPLTLGLAIGLALAAHLVFVVWLGMPLPGLFAR
ncbi:MAG: tripartite tricarboxylate transporter TctB family protein [Candidatus Rokubacteria bacterium]|nr:tripartite tricarboxylate transporter TctB family protein [Candidatus Rokubacteria bacterium]